MNLLEETISSIESTDYSVDDITFIGSHDGGYVCDWSQFKELADRTYNNGYGRQEVASDLVIVFSDGGRLHRCEYDGSEWWECIKPFVPVAEPKQIHSLFATIGWWGVKSIHEEDL